MKLCIDCRYRNDYNDCTNKDVKLYDDVNPVNGGEIIKSCWNARYNSNCGIEAKCFEEKSVVHYKSRKCMLE